MKLPFRDKDVIRSIRPWIYLSTYILLLGFLLVHLQDLKNGFDFVLSVFKSLLYAIVFAYVLNLPMKHIEGFLLRHTKQDSFLQKKKRVISMILTFLLALILIILIGSIILPSIIDSLISLMENLTSFFTNIVKNIDEVLAYFHIDYRIENITQVEQFIQMPWEKIVTNVINLLSGSASGILSSATGFVSSFAVGFTGFMFSLYLLSGKENFIRQMRKVTAAFLGYGNSKIVFRYAARVNRIFSSFIGGQLTEAVRRRPYSVVLLDEIEKAHPDVANILLQIMEDGALTDSEGRRVDFTHTLVILTSNLGAKHLAGQRAALGFGTGAPGEGARAEVMREVREHFSPELLGRLDEVLVFGPLAQEDLVAIGETLLRELEARAAQQGIRLAHTPAAARLLVREAYEPSSGARSLRRAITRRVEQCLAQQLLGGVENGAAADFLLDAPQDVLSLARRCGTAANAAQGGVRGGGEADAPEQNAAAPAPDTVQACNL